MTMNPSPAFHVPPAESRLIQRLVDTTIALHGEEADELVEQAEQLRNTIRTASVQLESLEKRFAELRDARDNALREIRDYHSGAEGKAGDEPGDENPNYDPARAASFAGAAGGSMADSAGPGTAIGSASDVSDEEVAAAQAEAKREAEARKADQASGRGEPDPLAAE